MNPLTTKAQSLKLESNIPWSIARRPKKPREAQEGHRKTAKSNNRQEKWQSQAKWQERARKSSEEQEKLKLKANAQNQYSPWNQLPLTLSMQALPLR
jgi:hypothetical protein